MRYKDTALICRKTFIALIALDKCIKNENINILRKSIYNLRLSLVPQYFSSPLKRKMVYANIVPENLWHFPSIVKKEIIEASKKNDIFFNEE